MSWEIQGSVSEAADVDALVADPTETPKAHETDQVSAVTTALKELVTAGVVGGPVFVRAGGHRNLTGQGAEEGQPDEMVTLTVVYDRPAPEPEAEPEPEPTWGRARTNTPEEVAAAEGRTLDPEGETEPVVDDAGE